ncbi:MAG: hypothetical protein HZC36_08630 [Armatimonadetes bacterium]|nr:hypothetical protein [Armatimonadota bacterium]
MKRRRIWIGVALIALFLLLVWPTPFRYETIDRYIHIRENRLTGSREAWTVSGWVDAARALE